MGLWGHKQYEDATSDLEQNYEDHLRPEEGGRFTSNASIHMCPNVRTLSEVTNSSHTAILTHEAIRQADIAALAIDKCDSSTLQERHQNAHATSAKSGSSSDCSSINTSLFCQLNFLRRKYMTHSSAEMTWVPLLRELRNIEHDLLS
jgi:hypothetical protein